MSARKEEPMRERTWSQKASVVGITILGCLLFSGCVAQQADVVRMKRDLDGKIAKLNGSKGELQAAVTEANEALQEANTIIAQQRGEIKELLHARADMLDQITTLRDGALPEVRGEVDQSLHGLDVVTQQLKGFNQEIAEFQRQAKEKEEARQADFKELVKRVNEQGEVMAAYAARDQEFRTSLVEFKQALSTLRDNVLKQDTQVREASRRVDGLVQQNASDATRTTTYLDEMNQSVTSVAQALEKVNQTHAARAEEQEQRLVKVANTVRDHSTNRAKLRAQAEQVTELTRSVTQLREALDLVVSKIGKRVDAHEEELARLSQRAGESFAIPTLASPTSPMPRVSADPVVPSVESGEVSPGVQSSKLDRATESSSPAVIVYQQVQKQLRQGDLQGALIGFSDFLKQYPESSLAANSQYWMGECYYGTRQFRKAIQEFERVVTMYQSSQKVPAALLKIGYSHLELQDRDLARATFRQLVRSYPKTPEAARAYARLTELNGMSQETS